MIGRRAVVACALAAGVHLWSAGAGLAAPAGVAVIVGNNVGLPGEPVLRFAEDDATRIAEILGGFGPFAPDGIKVLRGRTAVDMRRAIDDAEALLAKSDDGLLFIYYSGHADGESLHLGGTSFSLRELQALVGRSDVATRLMIVDACRSGTLTQTKGGSLAGDFDVRLAPPANPRGLAIVTSSAAGEEAQESDELRASFFTHHFAAALLGAADQDGDGAVTLGEAFAYAARHTVTATALTRAGPQHPTFKLELGGREDLVLTRPRTSARFGHLTLRDPGWYLVRRQRDGTVVAELTSDGVGRPVAVAAGRYEITRRADDQVSSGTFDVAPATETAVGTAGLRRIEFGRVVRKGGTSRRRAAAVYASGGVRGPLLALGSAWGGGVGGRLDLSVLTLAAALDVSAGSHQSTRGTQLQTTEVGLRFGALRAFDLPGVTLALGAAVGVSRFSQSASDQMLVLASYAGHAGPVALAEIPLSRRWFVWAEAAAPIYLLRVQDDTHVGSGASVQPTFRFTVALGGYL